MTVKVATHTPGPWHINTIGENLYVEHDAKPNEMVFICDLQRSDSEPSDIPEIEANARLIAAAPQLLAALEHVLVASEDGGTMNDIDWNMLRTAIALAEGR